ncbi:MAG: 23S rRNA (pseudouridine(1915)-N(3))-methyltransferase RlmH [Oscillospiraceae bacterium]|nr:23S rRNA (pseudouridine(1915)-N(3))-methyltransferase RlmH [Oscillospiraceae bacterium]
MLKVKLICVGRLKEKFYIDACAEYIKRLGRYCRFELCEVQESGNLEKEGAAVLEKIPAGAFVIAMCIEGRLMDSETLAAEIAGRCTAGCSQIVLLIGGSDGLSERAKARAQLRLSMSPMTFPHHLARVMVLEQLYRAFTIQEGSKYHK